MGSRSVIGEREPREREHRNGDGVLPLESVMMSCFFREQGNGLRESRESRGIETTERERSVIGERERTVISEKTQWNEGN
jgi:hypothetical protein